MLVENSSMTIILKPLQYFTTANSLYFSFFPLYVLAVGFHSFFPLFFLVNWLHSMYFHCCLYSLQLRYTTPFLCITSEKMCVVYCCSILEASKGSYNVQRQTIITTAIATTKNDIKLISRIVGGGGVCQLIVFVLCFSPCVSLQCIARIASANMLKSNIEIIFIHRQYGRRVIWNHFNKPITDICSQFICFCTAHIDRNIKLNE